MTKPMTEYEIFDRLPKEVQDAIRNSPVELNVTWHLLNIPTWLALKVIKGAIDDIQKKRPVFEPLTASGSEMDRVSV